MRSIRLNRVDKTNVFPQNDVKDNRPFIMTSFRCHICPYPHFGYSVISVPKLNIVQYKFWYVTSNNFCFPVISGEHKVIWVMGSSIPKYAEQSVEINPDVKELRLDELLGYRILWHGVPKMTWRNFEKNVEYLLSDNPPPQFLVIHLGCYDLLALVNTKDLIDKIKSAIRHTQEKMPNTVLIWSELLPRLYWHGAQKSNKTDKMRKQVNSTISKFIIENGGKYLRHVNIVPEVKYFRDDGANLSHFGNTVYLNAMHEGLKQFITTSNSEYVSKSLNEGVFEIQDARD